MNKVFLVEQNYEQIGFPLSSLAEEFINRTGDGTIREIEVLNTLPSSFRFCASIESGEVIGIQRINSRICPEDRIIFDNPTKLYIYLSSPNIEAAKISAVDEAACFLGRYKDVKLNATYNLATGEELPTKSYPGYETILIPMTESMKKHALALLSHDDEAATYWSLVTTLTFWASPSSDDGHYHFTFKENGKHGEWSQEVTRNKITFWSGDEDYVIKVAEENGFKVVSGQRKTNSSHELIMERVL